MHVSEWQLDHICSLIAILTNTYTSPCMQSSGHHVQLSGQEQHATAAAGRLLAVRTPTTAASRSSVRAVPARCRSAGRICAAARRNDWISAGRRWVSASSEWDRLSPTDGWSWLSATGEWSWLSATAGARGKNWWTMENTIILIQKAMHFFHIIRDSYVYVL